MLGHEPEAELIGRCTSGDPGAFRELIEIYHQRVYQTAYALVANDGDAREVEQETFIKAWKALAHFRGEASLSTWLTCLALNAARDHLRRRRARGLLHSLLSIAHAPGGAWRRGCEDALERVEQHDELQRALNHLSPPLRQVVGLRYGADMSIVEIAEVLGCPEGTVKSRLHTALQGLRGMLSDERGQRGARTNPRGVVDP